METALCKNLADAGLELSDPRGFDRDRVVTNQRADLRFSCLS